MRSQIKVSKLSLDKNEGVFAKLLKLNSKTITIRILRIIFLESKVQNPIRTSSLDISQKILASK